MNTKKSVADLVRETRDANPTMNASEIANKLGIKRQYVHSVFYLDRHKGKKKNTLPTKRGRPSKFETKVVEMPPLKHGAEAINTITLGMIHNATVGLKELQVASLEDEVRQLKAVVRYLEGKVYGASV